MIDLQSPGCWRGKAGIFLSGSVLPDLDTVREGFEPSVRFYSYNGLANRRFRPLSHLTNIFIINKLQNIYGLLLLIEY
jgi:hypothetical protein